jgi:hypothetical protein
MLPSIVYFILFGIGIGISMVRNGTPKTGNHSFISDFIGYMITIALLYWGGFFDVLIHAIY